MKITSVNVKKVEKEGSRMKGKASILLDDSFAVHDIRIIEGEFICKLHQLQFVKSKKKVQE